MDGLDRPFSVELIAKGDIFDVRIDGRRTLVMRAPSSASGNRLFLFAQDDTTAFEKIEIDGLAEPQTPGILSLAK